MKLKRSWKGRWSVRKAKVKKVQLKPKGLFWYWEREIPTNPFPKYEGIFRKKGESVEKRGLLKKRIKMSVGEKRVVVDKRKQW